METQYYWHILEILIIIGVIIYQIIHTIEVNSSTIHLKSVFRSKLFLRNGIIKKEEVGNIDFNLANIVFEDTINKEDQSLLDFENENTIIYKLLTI